MKTHFLILLSLVFYSYLFGQNIEIAYEDVKKTKHIQGLTLSMDIKEKLLEDARTKGLYRLDINNQNQKSVYTKIVKEVVIDETEPKLFCNTIFYKDHILKESYMVSVKDTILQKPYAVVTKFEEFNWKTDYKETKKIAGYSCKKATAREGEITFTVWYAPSLPYADGPYRFGGLEGLILEVDTKANTTTAISVEEVKQSVSIPESFKAIKRHKFPQRLRL